MFMSMDGHGTMICEFPRGHSVYALDISPDGSSLAIGTKGGWIKILAISHSGQTGATENSTEPMIQGSPLLSICWANESTLAASDLAGRILLWSTNNREPEPFFRSRSAVCSLVRITGTAFAGLCADGTLLIWHFPDNEPQQSFSLLPPPPLFAFSKLRYLSDRELLIYPGREGKLITHSPVLSETRELQAHQGDFYVALPYRDQILTIGRFDGRLKAWRDQDLSLLFDRSVPKGVIGALICPSDPSQLVLLTEDGKARFFLLDEEEVGQPEIIEGSDFRAGIWGVAGGYDPSLKKALVREKAGELELALGKGDAAAAGLLYAHMKELGYEHVGLAVTAEHALRKSHYLEALHSSHQLVQLLPPEDPRSCDWFGRHAQLLALFGFIQDAAVTREAIETLCQTLALQLKDTIPPLCFVENGVFILDTEINMQELMGASHLLSYKRSGYCVVKKLDAWLCEHMRISASEFADKFNSDVAETDRMSASAEIAEAIWITRHGWEKRETALLHGDVTPSAVQWSLCFDSVGTQTLITPNVLYRWDANTDISMDTLNSSVDRESFLPDPSILNFAYDSFRKLETKARAGMYEQKARQNGAQI